MQSQYPAVLYKVFNYLFSFEALFVLFIFSPQYKNANAFLLNPDITLILACILIGLSFYLYDRRSSSSFDLTFLSCFVFTSWCLASAFWSPSYKYMLSKSLCFVVYTAPAFLLGRSIIGKDPAGLKRLINLVAIFAILIHCEAYRAFIKGNRQIGEVLGNNYLITGQTVGAGLLILISFSFFRLSKVYKGSLLAASKDIPFILAVLLCGTFTYLLFHLGGRGPVIAALMTLGAFYIYGLLRADNRMDFAMHASATAGVCIIIYTFISWVLETETNPFLERLRPSTILSSPDESLALRFQYYSTALQAFREHPIIGIGFGGWPIFQGLGDTDWHPHNTFLEILSETGLVGVLFFMVFLVSCLQQIAPKSFLKNPSFLSSLFLLGFSFFNALKSGDLNDNILLFTSLGLVSGLQLSLSTFASRPP